MQVYTSLVFWTDRFGNRHRISWGAMFVGIVRKKRGDFASSASDSPLNSRLHRANSLARLD